MSGSGGYVYILTNPALPGLLKIGKTTRTPQVRAAELSKPTGVPKPFEVVYSLYVLDCHRVEKRVHQKLSRVRVRGREFFELSLSEAIAMVDNVGAPYRLTANRARQRARRIFGDTLSDLFSGVATVVWYLMRILSGLFFWVGRSLGGLAAKILFLGVVAIWCIHSAPGCLQSFDRSDKSVRSRPRKQCKTQKCRTNVRQERAKRKARRRLRRQREGEAP